MRLSRYRHLDDQKKKKITEARIFLTFFLQLRLLSRLPDKNHKCLPVLREGVKIAVLSMKGGKSTELFKQGG